jgi:murein DD-endopeptidase MepM/ murein hydrolase activator NlpD
VQRPSLYIAILFLTAIIVCLPISNNTFLFPFSKEVMQSSSENILSKPKQKVQNSKLVVKQSELQGLTTKKVGSFDYYRLSDLTAKSIVQGNIDTKQEVCIVQKGKHNLRFERNVQVVLDSGLYESMLAPPVFLQQECYLPKETVENLVTLTDDAVLTKRLSEQRRVLPYNANQLTSHLSFLQSPIPGSHVSTKDSSLPGAPRAYRHGVHEGLDWYTYGTGKVIDKNTPVFSLGKGVVVRADTNYKEMNTLARNRLLTTGSKNDGQTHAYILDKLRGRSVWVQFANGVMARYCHLDQIAKDIKVGTHVNSGDLIGYVGNSGTSDGAIGNNKGLHLHLDIMIYGNWIWGKYSISERRMILENVFNK